MAEFPSKQEIESESSRWYCLTTKRQFCILSREKRMEGLPSVYIKTSPRVAVFL